MTTSDWIVIMMTASICIVLVGVLVKEMFFGLELSTDRAKIVAGVITSMLAIISMYIGNSIGNGGQ